MVPLEELASLAIAVTSAHLGLRDLVPLGPLVTKDKRAFPGALGPLACQVQKAKQEGLFPYLAPLEQMGSQGPLDSQDPKVTEDSLGPRADQASLGRRVLWASRGLDFLGLRAPKVWTACPETRDLPEAQAAQDLTVHLAAQGCLARRESLEWVSLGSKDCLAFLVSPAPLERRAASGDQASLGSTERLAPLGFRASEVTLDLPEHRAPQAHQGLQDSVPLEPWVPPEDRACQAHQVLLE